MQKQTSQTKDGSVFVTLCSFQTSLYFIILRRELKKRGGLIIVISLFVVA